MNTLAVQSISHYSKDRYISFIYASMVYTYTQMLSHLFGGELEQLLPEKNNNNTHSNKTKKLKSTNVKAKP